MTAIASGNDIVAALTNGAITSVDNLISKATGGSNGNPQTRWVHREPRLQGAAMPATVSGQWESLWTMEGGPISHGAVPTTWANPTNTTPGSWMQANASGGRNIYITALQALITATPGTLLVYDRLGNMAGLSGNVSGDQQCNGGSPGPITRYTNGIGNFIAAEIYTSLGVSSSPVLTMTYANDGGSPSTGEGLNIGGVGLAEAGRMLFYPLALGELGVQSVTKVNLNGVTGSVGNWGVTIGHPLYAIGIANGNYATAASFVDGPIPQVLANACVACCYLPSLAASPIVEWFYEMVEA